MTSTTRPHSRGKTKPFVVFINFPNNSKEYAYLCDIPNIVQGSYVIANGVRVKVIRTAAKAPLAQRWVLPLPDAKKVEDEVRKAEIIRRLRQLQFENSQLELWEKLARKNTEAKKLLAEYRRL